MTTLAERICPACRERARVVVARRKMADEIAMTAVLEARGFPREWATDRVQQWRRGVARKAWQRLVAYARDCLEAPPPPPADWAAYKGGRVVEIDGSSRERELARWFDRHVDHA